MNPSDLQKIKGAFNAWANTHDTPDRPSMFEGTTALTPRQYADEVLNETPRGKNILQFAEDTMKRSGQTVDEVCAWINPKGSRPKTP